MIRLKSSSLWTILALSIAVYNMSMLGSIVYPASGDIMKSLFIVCGCAGFFCFGTQLRRNDMFLVCAVAIIYLLLMWCNGSSMGNAIALVARFVSSYLFCQFCCQRKIDWLNVLANICYCIIFAYLILFFLFEVMPNSFSSQSVLKTMSYGARDNRQISVVRYWDYYHLYFRRQMIEIGNILLPRCSAIFSEPGMYQIVISYCMWYFLFVDEKRSMSKVFVCVLSMITSTSTMGTLILLFFMGLFFYQKSKDVNRINNKIMVLLASLIGVILLIVIGMMVLSWKSTSFSMERRMNDIDVFFSSFQHHWLLGLGLNRYQNSSSGIWIILSELGIFGSYILIAIFILSRLFTHKYGIFAGMGFAAWMLLSLLNEPCVYTDFFMVFVAYAFTAEPGRYRRSRKEKVVCLTS